MSSDSHGGYADANAVTLSQGDLEYAYWLNPPDNGLYPSVVDADNLPLTPVEGQCVWVADVDRVAIYNGTAWLYLTPGEEVATYALQSKVGNLLTANQASATDTLGDTTGFLASGSTIASVDTAPHQGTKCLRVTSVAGGNSRVNVGSTTGVFPVIPGTTYTFRAMQKSDVSVTTGTWTIYWWTSAGNVAASTASVASASVPLSSTWNEVSVTAVAPANAAFASMRFTHASSVTNDEVFLDALSFHVGAGGDFVMPGTPVPNLGVKVSHPNVTDTLVQRWDTSKAAPGWQTVWADTGTRALTLINGWTATSAILRRTSAGVELVLIGLNGASATSGTLYVLESFFRPTYAKTAHISSTATGLPTHLITVASAGSVVVGGTYTEVTAGAISLNFSNLAVWPNSLPGASVTAAPV